MSEELKISPAFEPFLADSDDKDRRDAIVVYRAADRQPSVRGRLRALKSRLDAVAARAAVQKQVQLSIASKYARAGGATNGHRASSGPALVEIGGSALPVGRVRVSRETLPLLAKDPDVVAIMPNQRIHLLKPNRVEYSALRRVERRNRATWGLQRLEIPGIWATTKGRDVSVAVLDTGVYGEHPALVGRVAQFVVIDPLARRIQASPTFDCGNHGTHVCGSIAGGETPDGVRIGVAPEANLLVAGVLVGQATLLTLIEGISWAVENGADIISMSLGFTYYEPLFSVSVRWWPPTSAGECLRQSGDDREAVRGVHLRTGGHQASV